MERTLGTRRTATTILLVCTALAAPGAAPRDGQDPPAFRSGIELVTVDVGVVDRQGRPVPGLSPSDFVVNVGGEPRRVVSAEFIDTTAAREQASTPTALPISTNEGAGIGRLFVFVVDQNTLEPGNVRHVMQAASSFVSGLSFADRSALLLMPAGPHVNFTWAHDRVRTAMLRVTGLSSPTPAWEFGSLSEAREIANRNTMVLRNVGMRECGTMSASSGFGGGGATPSGPLGGSPGGGGAGGQGGGPGGGGGGGGTEGGGGGPGSGGGVGGGGTPGGGAAGGGGGGGGGAAGGGGAGSGSRGSGGGGFGTDGCSRDIQMRADWAWRSAQLTSLASLSSLRQVLAGLAQVRGDKTIILVSGGWPLDDREQTSMMNTVAAEAAQARATVFTLFVPQSTTSASRRLVSSTPIGDQQISSWPLETLAGMTGGGSFRVEVGAQSAFERIERELAGYYRLGVEKNPADADGRGRRLRVQVPRSGLTVRAREIFDTRTYEDRDWAARLGAALDGPIPATAIGLKVASYLAVDDEHRDRLKLVLTGEASRLEPGEATVQVVIRDPEGRRVLSGEQPVGDPDGDGLSFSTNIPVPPGSYVVRVAVMDGRGQVGSVDHRVDVQASEIGDLMATGPMLVRVPLRSGEQPRLALQAVGQDERLAIQVDLQGDTAKLSSADVLFEIAADDSSAALVEARAFMAPGGRSGVMLAQGVADVRRLPAGEYVLRARVSSEGQPLGVVRRAFAVREAAAVPDESIVAGTSGPGTLVSGRPAMRAMAAIPRFAMEDVMAPPVLGAFLDRVAARPDAASPMIRELIAQARSRDVSGLFISETLAAEYPVAAFLRGLSLLAQQRLEPAAAAFRSAMRASADFYPAMIYLGACYAAGGNDREAAGAWRTALIREGDAAPLHALLADAFLRQSRTDQALETLVDARARWPDDIDLKRRYVLAALVGGRREEGLQGLDELIQDGIEDEPGLTAGLLVLHDAFASNSPVQDAERDRARMTRFADAYRTRGGPSMALIETWLDVARPRP